MGTGAANETSKYKPEKGRGCQWDGGLRAGEGQDQSPARFEAT
jgi:hypothetical protein